MSKIEIQVIGSAGSGKSAIMDLINKTLIENGFTTVTNQYLDQSWYPFTDVRQKERLEYMVSKNIPIVINEVQSKRSNFEE
jgi:ABC-type phosphate/phosphonate transport system ATPase subunit